MAKGIKTAFVCSDCGADYPKWQGQCSSCKSWNTITQVNLGRSKTSGNGRYEGFAGARSEVKTLNEVEISEETRFSSSIHEFDRVLGGGFVPGSVILLGGDPGGGKSTILLQAMCIAAQERSVLYVSGEESLPQIAGRAKRIGLPTNKIKMLAETSVEKVCEIADKEKPEIIVIDSIQVMYMEDVDSAPGGVTQVRESAAFLTRYVK
ncbi:MAG TPA: ATPase domain-containing protein, partial [Alphaproteobacteria bacterium]|nr:ATPase domain-containing protein [Alphaproteobacteria bacterium]